MNDWTNWQKRLAGEEVPTYEMEFDWGFYRRPIRRDPENRRKVTGWQPIAIFADESDKTNRTVCLIGDTPVYGADAISEVWLHCVKYPITEEQYRKAADEGIWFDADPTVTAERAAVEVLDSVVYPEEALANQIAEAKKGAASYAKIEDDETASKAQDLRSHLTTLAGKLDKERKELVQPHLDAQREINGRLNPIIKEATEAAAGIKKSQEAWEMVKRSSTSPNVPPPKAQIRGSTGRASAVKEAFDAVIVDIIVYFQSVRDAPEVTELLQKLAQKDIDAGLRPAGVEAKPTIRIR